MVFKRIFCSLECMGEYQKKNRKGKNNPNYKDGMASWQKFGRRPIYTPLHFRACKKYRKAFIEKEGYERCEVCGRSNLPTHVHHIYYASRFPKHENLHDFRNLIMVCVQCHNDFHGGKLKEIFKEIEYERDLKNLFSS